MNIEEKILTLIEEMIQKHNIRLLKIELSHEDFNKLKEELGPRFDNHFETCYGKIILEERYERHCHG